MVSKRHCKQQLQCMEFYSTAIKFLLVVLIVATTQIRQTNGDEQLTTVRQYVTKELSNTNSFTNGVLVEEPMVQPVMVEGSKQPSNKRSDKKKKMKNRYQPKFTVDEYKQTVNENMPAGTSILAVHAVDNDLDENGHIKYRVSDPEHFRIDEGGVLYNIKPLDFEHTGGEYRFHILAEDQGVDRKTARVPVDIRVLDTPDPPHFDSTQYVFTVSEFAHEGDYVGTVVARDADKDFEDGYSLEGLDKTDLFLIDSTTGIITRGAGSRSDWVYRFKAKATDKNNNDNTADVEVKFIDENTNKPVFSECHTYDETKVLENAINAEVIQVIAEDDDHGDNGVVVYELLNSFDSFIINSTTGQISTSKSLNREERQEYFLTVIGKDSAKDPLQGACSFSVLVEDDNDNAPVFDKDFYEQSVPYNKEVDSRVLRVTASDDDADMNGKLSYSLEGSDFFSIVSETGYIKLIKKLSSDMADVQEFELTVTAIDGGSPPLSASVSVIIRVVSTGVMPPTVLSLKPESPTVSEDVKDDTQVAVICAKSNNDDPQLFFNMIPGNSYETNSQGTFSVRAGSQCGNNGREGIIFVASNLDYESIRGYKLMIEIIDVAGEKEDYQVSVDIVDVNDNIPQIMPPYSATVIENAQVNTLITTIIAVDRDISKDYKRIEYRIGWTNDDDIRRKFHLDEMTGELKTLQELNREEKSKYRIPIIASDGVHDTTSVSYWISVTDTNDEPPVFDLEKGTYSVLLPETTDPGKDTGIKLVVNDPDVANDFSYQIISGNDEEKFRINSETGDILVNKKLEYDEPVNDRNFTMRVRVGDGLYYADTEVKIAVTDMNDQPPEFSKETYQFSATENTECDIIIGKVTARDPDLNDYLDQNILYSLSEEENKNFTINKYSGAISTNGCLDREATKLGTMTLFPRATDNGGVDGLDAAPATIIITINDINDNYPFIQSPENSYTRIMENTSPTDVAPIAIQLDDLDSNEYGCPCTLEIDASAGPDIKNSFAIMSVDDKSLFHLKPLKEFDREQQKLYKIPLRAADREGESGLRTLTVEIDDENDSPMSDGESYIHVYNVQGQFPDMVIGSVYVTDADDYDIPDKTFEIDTTTEDEVREHFEVDLNSGNITMKTGTPGGTYPLYVKVVDNYRNEIATGTVMIKVVDLPIEAIRQSGSLRIKGKTAQEMITQKSLVATGTSLYDRLQEQIAQVFEIQVDQVDIFALVDREDAVDVRYNCHSSPYYTAPRLNGILIQYMQTIEKELGIDIALVDINECLYESISPCGEESCYHNLVNLTSPHVMKTETSTIVGVKPEDEYKCHCGATIYIPEVCTNDYCLNGGTCNIVNGNPTCTCLDEWNYGSRCELKTARFKEGYAWYRSLDVCENPTIKMTFDTKRGSGILLYNGPIISSPWNNYPKDFLYVLLENWEITLYLELGSGTVRLAIPIEQNNERDFIFSISWNHEILEFEVENCITSKSNEDLDSCKKTISLPGFDGNIKPLLNVQSPLQVGGVISSVNFNQLSNSYGWSHTPEMPKEMFEGCIKTIQFNEYLYDMNSTDYFEEYFPTCSVPINEKVVTGDTPLFIIIVCSLLLLLIIILIILCVARQRRKYEPFPPEDLTVVKETVGPTDIEGSGEKDITNFDLSILRVNSQANIINGGPGWGYPDVIDTRLVGQEPIDTLSMEGISTGKVIQDNMDKIDGIIDDNDDLRHYAFEGDGDTMSIASLSSIGSGSTENEDMLENVADWGDGFKKLAEIYTIEEETDEDEDSEYEFPEPPKKPSRTQQPPLTFNEITIPPIGELNLPPPPPIEEYSISPMREDRSISNNKSSNNSLNGRPKIVSELPKSVITSTANTASYPHEYDESFAGSAAAPLLPPKVSSRPLSVRKTDNQLLVNNNNNTDQLEPETHPLLNAEGDRHGWDEFMC